MSKWTTDSKFLSHADISDESDTSVTIKSYAQEQLGQGAQAREKWVLYFRECTKGLALNKTNGKVLVKLFGEEMDDWIGEKIQLYVKDDVEFQGDVVSAIRIRPTKPKKKSAPPNGAVLAMDLDGKIAACESTKECLELAQTIARAEGLSQEDREVLTVAVQQRLVELQRPA